MKKCDNCKKETEQLYFHQARIPNFVIKENKIPENLDEIIQDPSKIKISVIDMWICEECRNELIEHRSKLDKKLRDHLVESQRKQFEKGEIEDLK